MRLNSWLIQPFGETKLKAKMQAAKEKIKEEKVKAAKAHDLQESQSDAVISKEPSLTFNTHHPAAATGRAPHDWGNRNEHQIPP